LPKAHYTHRVVSMAVRLVVEDGLPYRRPVGTYGATIACSFLRHHSELGGSGGKKGPPSTSPGRVSDEALADFSGYIAADELYDGPYWRAVHRGQPHLRRLIYEVLDHDPTHKDIRRFFQRFKPLSTPAG